MQQLSMRQKKVSEFNLRTRTPRSFNMQAQKLASGLLRHSAMAKKYLPEGRLPHYTEFKRLVHAIYGNNNVANQCRSMKVYESLKDLRHLQLIRYYCKQAKSVTQTRLSPQIHKSYVDVKGKHQDLSYKQDVYCKNLELLSHINGIQRVCGSVDCFNRNFQANEPNRFQINKDAEELKRANHRIGCRLLRVKSKVDSFNPSFLQPPTDLHDAPADVVQKYSSYMPLVSPKKRVHSAKELLRPIIYFDLSVRKSQLLGRLSIQLYTEVSPAVVLEFVRLAADNDVQAHKFTHIFPDLWMRGALSLQSRDALENHHTSPSPLDARQQKGLLSYSWNHRKQFPNGLLLYTITFKTLADPLQRVIFGRVLSGVRLLEVCREYGTKGGHPKRSVEVVKCGLL
ncbi:uncharacterized protein LOC117788618 [Drosophila innubila]|uniref:uncharacterized protein LOC117788618 n=1 Tax=Drosophila innubila TaxID=198719 RepID=UPI00148B5454|nr:uncharacterized protein LOC117788618 [Drosophila innubila]